MKNQMDRIRLVQRDGSVDMFSADSGELVAIIFKDVLLNNILQNVFGADPFEPVPFIEDVALAREFEDKGLSGEPDKRRRVHIKNAKQAEYWRKSIVRYVQRTDSDAVANLLEAEASKSIYVERSKRNNVWVLYAYPYNETEMEYLKANGWELT